VAQSAAAIASTPPSGDKARTSENSRFFMRGLMPENHVSTKTFQIRRETPGDEAARATTVCLAEEVAGQHGPRDEKPFALVARDASEGWIGGVNGVIHWRWLYVAQFFLTPEWRGNGLGHSLLAEAEKLAHENACVGIYLDTFDAGALEFYRKCGFAVAGRIENFPPGAARTFLSKALTPASA
jgi:GNAT superfamily N-acetyltransferase